MTVLFVHVGTPRTATTVLQKHLFPLSDRNLVLSKKPFANSCLTQDAGSGHFSLRLGDVDGYLKQVREDLDAVDWSEFAMRLVLPMSVSLGCASTSGLARRLLLSRFADVMQLVDIAASKRERGILLSSERLSDTSASLNGDSSHRDGNEVILPSLSLGKFVHSLNRFTVCFNVCFREPIAYLASKYSRTCLQRSSRGLRRLLPREFIQKQCALERSVPRSSAIFVAAHSKYLNSMQEFGFVKAFGFDDLLQSENVFQDLGLSGEKTHSFRSFARENSSNASCEEKILIESEIRLELERQSFLDYVLDSQLFE